MTFICEKFKNLYRNREKMIVMQQQGAASVAAYPSSATSI
jgi:hypothetical protein